MSDIKKRSIIIGGRKTSVCLEDEFWESLSEIAREGRKSASRMIADIKAERKSSNLSSSIRLFILRYYRDRDQSNQSDERAASLVPQRSFATGDLLAD